MRTQDILEAHPSQISFLNVREACINAALACAGCCTTCADACLHEDDPSELRPCIARNLDCADVCSVTARLLSRPGTINKDVLRAQLQACKVACDACAAHCQEHEDEHEHCRVCKECCQECSAACDKVLAAL